MTIALSALYVWGKEPENKIVGPDLSLRTNLSIKDQKVDF